MRLIKLLQKQIRKTEVASKLDNIGVKVLYDQIKTLPIISERSAAWWQQIQRAHDITARYCGGDVSTFTQNFIMRAQTLTRHLKE